MKIRPDQTDKMDQMARRNDPPEPPRPARQNDESNEESDNNADLFPEEPEDPVAQPALPAPAVQPAVQLAVHCPSTRPPSDEDLVIAYYRQVLCFNDNAAHSLAFDQQLAHPSNFLELEEDDIDNICQAIRKPGGIGVGSQVAIISVTRLKLTLFYVKLNHCMPRLNPAFDKITRDYLALVKDQRKVEREYAKTKGGSDPKPLTLELVTAPACFQKVKTLLSTLRGASVTLLRYVIREDIYPLREGGSSYFRKWKHRHSTIDLELIDRAPILADGVDLTRGDSVLEAVGPFSPPFSIDMKACMEYPVCHVWPLSLLAAREKVLDPTERTQGLADPTDPLLWR